MSEFAVGIMVFVWTVILVAFAGMYLGIHVFSCWLVKEEGWEKWWVIVAFLTMVDLVGVATLLFWLDGKM